MSSIVLDANGQPRPPYRGPAALPLSAAATREYRDLLRLKRSDPMSTRPGRILRIQNVRAAMRMLPRPHRVLITRTAGHTWFHVLPDVGFNSWATRDLYELERFVRAHAAPLQRVAA